MPAPQIVDGKLLLKSTDNLWYYLDIIYADDQPRLRPGQVAVTVPTTDAPQGYFTLQADNGSYYNLALFTDPDTDEIHYTISDALATPVPAYKLFLRGSNNGIVYEVYLAEVASEIFAFIRSLADNVTTIQSPWKELFKMEVRGEYDITVPATAVVI
jgi:hypothetical protein